MTKLEKLKEEMLDAKKAYDDFLNGGEEIEYSSDTIDVFNIPTKKFELTQENILEYNRLHKKMEETHREFVNEYMKVK